MHCLVFASFLCCLIGSVVGANYQSVAVEGNIVCDGKPMANQLVELWEDDDPEADDYLNVAPTSASGHYTTQGYTEEKTKIRPYLWIPHNCTTKGTVACLEFDIPAEYISTGKIPAQTYMAETLELKNKGVPEGTWNCRVLTIELPQSDI